jgi:adenosine kinase
MSVVITGSVAYDYLMRFPGRFREHILPDHVGTLSLSFLADSMRRERGGVAANIAYTMKLLGGDPVIFATVGEDFEDYRRWLEKHGLNTEQIVTIPDELTATFFVSTDLENNQIANFYSGAMLRARDFSLADRGLTGADLVIVSPNDPVAMLNYARECQERGITYAFDPSQQTARLGDADFCASVPGASYLMCNEYELAMIQSKTGWSLGDILERVGVLVLTLGKDGSAIYSGSERHAIPVAPVHGVLDPTGAGDAYRAGFFSGRMAGLSLPVCGRMGALCSAYALEHPGPAGHHFTVADFVARYVATFGPELELAALAATAAAPLQA